MKRENKLENKAFVGIFLLGVIGIVFMEVPAILKIIFIFVMAICTSLALLSNKRKNRAEFEKGNICSVETKKVFGGKENEISKYKLAHSHLIAIKNGERVAIIEIVVRDDDTEAKNPVYISIKKFKKKYRFSNKESIDSMEELMML